MPIKKGAQTSRLTWSNLALILVEVLVSSLGQLLLISRFTLIQGYSIFDLLRSSRIHHGDISERRQGAVAQSNE